MGSSFSSRCGSYSNSMADNWDLLCSLNLRAWSDLYTGWSFVDAAFGGGLSRQEIMGVIGQYKLPPGVMGAFLHEVTHHLIFGSIFGVSLAALERGSRAAAEPFDNAADIPPDVAIRIVERQLRLMILSNMLKPLNE